jgi:hypothetical protein
MQRLQTPDRGREEGSEFRTSVADELKRTKASFTISEIWQVRLIYSRLPVLLQLADSRVTIRNGAKDRNQHQADHMRILIWTPIKEPQIDN